MFIIKKSSRQSTKQGKQKVAYYKRDTELDRPIVDNSKKYDISSGSEDEAPDFNYLLKQQSATGSHFIFKKEQEKFEGDIDVQFSKYFNIDIKLLNLAVKSIPFNERHSISGIEWSVDELNSMNKEAEINEKAYYELLNTKPVTEELKIEKKITKEVEQLKLEPVEEVTGACDDKKSMEKWLDDILDI